MFNLEFKQFVSVIICKYKQKYKSVFKTSFGGNCIRTKGKFVWMLLSISIWTIQNVPWRFVQRHVDGKLGRGML